MGEKFQASFPWAPRKDHSTASRTARSPGFLHPVRWSLIDRPEETLNVADLRRRSSPLKRNGSASIWDAGDGVLLVEYHTKMNAMDPMNMEMLLNAVDLAESGDYKGIVIGNDATNFCAGANLGLALFAANLVSMERS